jgi:lipid-A-disaccharide synthase-like uncharacterized protein
MLRAESDYYQIAISFRHNEINNFIRRTLQFMYLDDGGFREDSDVAFWKFCLWGKGLMTIY